MFFIDNFNEYRSEYVDGATKISIRSKWIKADSKDLAKKVSPLRNYDLYFSKKGVLLQSFHVELDVCFKRIYGYDKKGKVYQVYELLSESNELTATTTFIYNNEGLIESETYRRFNFDSAHERADYIIILKHSYYGLKEEILRTTNEIDEPDHTFYNTYNEGHLLVQEKIARHNEDQDLVSWYKYEYDTNGKKIKEISLDNHGGIDGSSNFDYDSKGNLIGRSYYPKDSLPSRQDYIISYNERHHKISETFMREGVISEIEERVIEYYI